MQELVATGPDAAARTGPFLDAAAAAGAVDSPVLARVYDAAVEQRADADVAYVIREWVDGTPLRAPYEFVVIGDPQGIETAMNIPGGVVQTIGNRGGSVDIEQSTLVLVDALRPLDRPQYAAPDDGD